MRDIILQKLKDIEKEHKNKKYYTPLNQVVGAGALNLKIVIMM